MNIDDSKWSFNEFLAFLLVYAAESDLSVSAEEEALIKQKTNVDVEQVKQTLNKMSDAEVMEVIEDYKKRFLVSPEIKARVKNDLEALLKTTGEHSQFETVMVRLLERLI